MTTQPDLRKFAHAIAVADTGSFVRASEQVHLTQSALTRSIQALEKELGITLFDRTRQGVEPTRDGLTILNKARALLRHGHSLKNEISLLRETAIGETAFGLGPALPPLFLSRLLTDFNRQHPDLTIDVFIESPPRLLEKLDREHIEFFVSGVQKLDIPHPENYCFKQLDQLQAHFFTRSDHPLVTSENTRLADLANYTVVTTQVTMNSPKEMTYDAPIPRPKIFCNDLPSMTRLLLDSNVVMFGVEATLGAELEAGTVSKIVLEDFPAIPSSPISLVSLAHRTPSVASEKIAAWIADFFEARRAAQGKP